jgi:hypothetical protein
VVHAQAVLLCGVGLEVIARQTFEANIGRAEDVQFSLLSGPRAPRAPFVRALQCDAVGMEIRRFAVEVFGQTMLMHGIVESPRRLTDLVNEPSPYIGLSEVSTYPYVADTMVGLERQQQGLINKASIVMLAEIEADAAPAPSGASELRIAKAAHRILVYTNQFAVNADIHLTPGVEMSNFLSISAGRFVPVTNATVLPVETRTQLTGFRRTFLLINRDQISYLGAAPEPAAAQPGPEGETIG